MRIMLDTCIWQNLALIKMKKDRKIPKSLKKSKELWYILEKKVKRKEIEIISTDWNLLEFRDQMTKLVLEKKLIENGYSLTEFKEAKREIELDKDDFKIIDNLVFIIPALSGKKRFDIDIDFKFLWKLCNTGISTFDAIHIQQANDNECNYFITRDNDLIAKSEKHKLKVKVVHLNSFLSRTIHNSNKR